MWISKHQMNREFQEQFGISIPFIPLKETGQNHAGNATRRDWNQVCSNNGTDEIYLIGKRWLSLLIRDNGACEYALAA